MASNTRCLFFFLLIITLSSLIHARESKYFSKVNKTTQKPQVEAISLAPAVSPALAPALPAEPELVEHGYGLYGRDNTVKPVEKHVFEEEKYVPAEELKKDNNNNENLENNNYSNNNFNEKVKDNNEYQYSPTTENPTKTPAAEKQGLSDTRFLENGKYYYDVSRESKDMSHYVQNDENENEKENVSEKQGMSDTRFLENGKYYYDATQDSKDMSNFVEKDENENESVSEKQGMSDTRFLENGKYYYDLNQNNNNKYTSNYVENEGNVKGRNRYVSERQGMSDTRYMENEKYSHDIQNDEVVTNENNVVFNSNNDESVKRRNGYVPERQGMSDTRYLENGKYFHDIQNDEGVTSENNVVFNSYNGNNKNEVFKNQGYGISDTRFLENGKSYYGENSEDESSKNLYKNNNYNYLGNSNEYRYAKSGGFSKKKLPNEYDTMEEYDREQGYINP